MTISTYKSGLLQAKAYRLLRVQVAKIFKGYNISIPEWNIMGHLYEQDGMRLADIAELLSVEAPLVTNLIDTLEKKGYVERKGHAEDKRAKVITLSSKGEKIVPGIEADASLRMRQLFKDISDEELTTYFRVLEKIIVHLS